MHCFLVFLVIILGSYSIDCFPRTSSLYRKAELVLKRYVTDESHDPIIHSLLNVLIHDRNARAFTSDQAIEQALTSIRKLDEQNNINSVKVLRQAIHGVKCKRNETDCLANSTLIKTRPPPSPALKQQIVSALDSFFSSLNRGDDDDDDVDPSSEATS